MQYSKDEETPAENHELPDIDAESYAFAVGVTKGGLTQAEAFRQSHPHSREWKPQSVWTEASKLRRKPNVARWITALRADMAREANYTREQAVQQTLEIVEKAANEGKYIAALNGIQLAAKLEGHLGNERQEKDKGKSDGLVAQIEKAFGAEAARSAAKKLGLETETVH